MEGCVWGWRIRMDGGDKWEDGGWDRVGREGRLREGRRREMEMGCCRR